MTTGEMMRQAFVLLRKQATPEKMLVSDMHMKDINNLFYAVAFCFKEMNFAGAKGFAIALFLLGYSAGKGEASLDDDLWRTAVDGEGSTE